MIRLDCRHDVFHALGDARDRRDGERVSFLTNSPHIARRVEGSKRREDLDSDEQGNVRVSELEISMGREGIQHWTQARPVQRNITSGGSKARQLGGSVKQPERDSALGD